METRIIKIDPAKPDAAAIAQAAAVVDGGGLVAFPTETVYGIACAADRNGLAGLGAVKNRAPAKHYTLHIPRKETARKYVPNIGLRARKLMDSAWPGPLTLVLHVDDSDIEHQKQTLGVELAEILYVDNSIGIRCPANAVACALLSTVHVPVVAPSANLSGQTPAVDAAQVMSQFSGQLDLILDAGQCTYGKSSTVATIGPKGLLVLRQGVYSKPELEEMAQVSFLFVCTGNSCRSPMAEGMFRKYLAEKVGCGLDDLKDLGYNVASAGTMGLVGLDASAEAIVACKGHGVDISSHSSSALTKVLVEQSDYIFAMSRSHMNQVTALDSSAGGRCCLLAQGTEVPDPIGQSQGVYDSCADLIEDAVKIRIGEFVI